MVQGMAAEAHGGQYRPGTGAWTALGSMGNPNQPEALEVRCLGKKADHRGGFCHHERLDGCSTEKGHAPVR